jgi:hypothetical protein
VALVEGLEAADHSNQNQRRIYLKNRISHAG